MMTIPKMLSDLLAARGEISFGEFMQQALYSPDFGYYTTAFPQLGPQGDFTTAPELTPLFGQTIALQCQPILNQVEQPCLLEFGAGTGRLAVDVMQQLERLNSLPEHYFILEVSGHLRDCQQALIHAEIPQLANRFQWLNEWPKQPFNGVIVANEVLDAMPVQRFLCNQQGIYLSMISLSTEGNLQEQFKRCQDETLNNAIQERLDPNHGEYLSEINTYLDDWLVQCSKILHQGVMLILDYGFPRQEYYHPDRHQGTLMCHYQHHAHTNPLLHIGQQDITAHVDFSHVAEAGHAAGFHVAGYTNQAAFLLAAGLPGLLEAIQDEHERIHAVQAVKQLLQPHEMGELFKVIALTKNYPEPLQGFLFSDKRSSL